jgi:multidrug transporter EmrE-like cation transporter
MIPLLVVSAAVALQIAGAVVLKTLADSAPVPPALLVLGIGAVALLNGLRFLAWGFAHRRYPLSTSYPLASLFFPLMLGVAWAYGDPIRAHQIAGAALVTAGVAWLALRART